MQRSLPELFYHIFVERNVQVPVSLIKIGYCIHTVHSKIFKHQDRTHPGYLNCTALTGWIFFTSNEGIINTKKQITSVPVQTASTCHQMILTAAELT